MISLVYRGLSLLARGSPVLDRIDLELEGPGVVALLGPSGVGKTTLLRATQRLIDQGRDGWRRMGDVRFNNTVHQFHVPRRVNRTGAPGLSRKQSGPRGLGFESSALLQLSQADIV